MATLVETKGFNKKTRTVNKNKSKPDFDKPVPMFIKPRWQPREVANIKDTAKQYAQAFNSDPFAYNRAVHYMLAGLEFPSDMLALATGILEARIKRKSSVVTVNTEH